MADDDPQPEEPEVEDLSLASTDALIMELRRRCEVMYFIGRPCTPEEFDWRAAFNGDIDRVLGLIEIGKHRLLNPRSDDAD